MIRKTEMTGHRGKVQGKNKKTISRMACLMILAAVLAGCGSRTTTEKKIGENNYDVDGVYDIVIPSGNEAAGTILGFEFNKADGSYKETITLGEESYTLFEGSYEVDETADLVTCTPKKGDVQNFIIAGNYLIAEGYFYDGEIPDDTSFDAVCTYTNSSGGTSTITFAKDGTYQESGGTSNAEGTYTRDGDFIHRTTKDGNAQTDLIIYNDLISNAFYIKR